MSNEQYPAHPFQLMEGEEGYCSLLIINGGGDDCVTQPLSLACLF
jgi:hypothetical protein